MKTINISTEFSKFPAGRVISDGPFSGQRFRDEIMAPALKAGGDVQVILDGTRGYGSSFLEEAFGGLVREHGFKADDLLKKIKFVSSRPIYIEEIKGYIRDAGNIK